MTVKAQIVEMIEFIPDRELPILLEVVRRFLPKEMEDFASEDDREAHHIASNERYLCILIITIEDSKIKISLIFRNNLLQK